MSILQKMAGDYDNCATTHPQVITALHFKCVTVMDVS